MEKTDFIYPKSEKNRGKSGNYSVRKRIPPKKHERSSSEKYSYICFNLAVIGWIVWGSLCALYTYNKQDIGWLLTISYLVWVKLHTLLSIVGLLLGITAKELRQKQEGFYWPTVLNGLSLFFIACMNLLG